MGYNGSMLWKLLPGCGGKVSRGSGTGSCYDEKLCCCCCGGVGVGAGGWRRCALLPSHLRRVMSRDGEIVFLFFTPPQCRSCTQSAGRYNVQWNYSTATVLRIMTSFMLLFCSSYSFKDQKDLITLNLFEHIFALLF